MPLDQRPIGELAAALMDRIEQAMGDEGTLGAVALVVEVNGADGGSQIFTTFSDSRIHVRLGMLEFARAVVERELGG